MAGRSAWTAAFLSIGLVLAGCQDDSETEAGSETAETSSAQGGGAEETGTSSSSATETATSDTGAASNEASDAATEAARSGESPSQAAEDTAQSAADEAGVTGALADGDQTVDDLLTPESWDSARVIAAIRASDLDQGRKDALVERVQTLEDGEGIAQRDEIIREVRDALISG